MEEDEFFSSALHYYIDGLAPMAVAPAALAGFVFFGKVLSVVDQNVGAFGEFAQVLVETLIAGFVVGGVNQNAFLALDAESQAALRVIQPHGLNRDEVVE